MLSLWIPAGEYHQRSQRGRRCSHPVQPAPVTYRLYLPADLLDRNDHPTAPFLRRQQGGKSLRQRTM